MSNAVELLIEKKEVKAVRKIIKLANKSYVLNSQEEVQADGSIHFIITCPKTNAAQAYWYLGILHHEHILSKRKK